MTDAAPAALTINDHRISFDESADLMGAHGSRRVDIAQAIVNRLRNEGVELSPNAEVELFASALEAAATVGVYQRNGELLDDDLADECRAYPTNAWGNDDDQTNGSDDPTGGLFDPKAKPVDRVGGADLLDSVRAFVARFVAFPSDHCLNAVTLWAAHAHAVEHFHTTPRLAILSTEAESGKTRTLEVLDLLTPESMLIFSPSTPTIFRTLAQTQATLLFDEVDTIFKKRQGEDTNEDLRALLNAGYRRGASIPRCVGPKHDVVNFEVFAAAALAGLGDLPDTILTRSIIIRMRRRTVAERVEPFRIRIHESQGHNLRDRLAEWAAEVGKAAGDAWPDLPDGVEDRQAEQWEPLIAIADIAGGEWPKRARDAAVSFVSSASTHTTLGVRLLSDLKSIFGDRDAMFTADIIGALKALEDAPWSDLHGKELDSNGLSYRLRKYGVEPRQVRIGEISKKGYLRIVEGLKDVKDGEVGLGDAWARYLRRAPSHPQTPETPETPETPVSPVSSVSPYAGQGAL